MTSNHEEFNDDELKAPEWLDKEFLLKVLRHCENDSEINIMTFKITPGTGKGDHYASIMFRVVINYLLKNEEKTKSLVIKLMPEQEGVKKDILKESLAFENEIAMYTEMIPKLEKLLKASGDDTKLAPQCLYHSLSPRKLIVLEDLVPLGYTVIRDRELNMEEVKNIFLKLAKWHAVSYKVAKEEPTLFEKYCHNGMSTIDVKENEFFTAGIKLFIEVLGEVPSLFKYKYYFEALAPTLIEKCLKSVEEYHKHRSNSSYYVLNHGDFHNRNMMFKSSLENEKHEDVLFFDFQFSYFGPIAMDLLYSFLGILSAEQRRNDFDELLFYYFTNFVVTLKKIDFKGPLPKLLQLRQQLLEHRHYAIFLLVSFLPMLHVRREEFDFTVLMTSSDARKNLFKIDGVIQELNWILPKFLHMGYLEV